MAEYVCDECGGGIRCELDVSIGEPGFCPISGDAMDCGEWVIEEEQVKK